MINRSLARATKLVRASATNALASLAPRFYIQLTDERGRGAGSSRSPQQTAEYFWRCFHEYFERAGEPDIERFLNGKTVLEYGPGDLPAVALLMVAHGARRAICVDRFPLVRFDAFSVAVIEILIGKLQGDQRTRAQSCLSDPGRPGEGFRGDLISYVVTESGLSSLRGECDLAVSRAVLEHVNDLPATMQDIATALRPGAVSIHKVDLGSHGLHDESPLDFLAWSDSAWSIMYSAKGVPNRLRVDAYRRALADAKLEVLLLAPEERYGTEDVAAVRGRLPRQFSGLSDEELAWKNFWLVCRKPD